MRLANLAAACLAGALCIFLGGCRGQQQAASNGLTPVRLQVDWYPQPEHGGFFTALRLGYYKEEGLDVTILPLPQYGSVAQLVANGKVDFGLGASDAILEWNSNGLPLVTVSATMQHDPQAIMVHKDSPIHDFKDLDGHTIAAQTGATWLKYVTLRYGLHEVKQVPSTLSIASFLNDPGYVQQVFVTSEPYFAKQAGVEARTMLISSSGYDPYRVTFTTRDFVAQHPDVAAKFVRASIRGWKEYLRDPEPTNAMLLKLNPALNPAQMNYTFQALRDGGFIDGGDKSGATIGHMDAARIQANYEQMKALGILHGPVDPAATYTMKFVP